jgi:hypothetical protein
MPAIRFLKDVPQVERHARLVDPDRQALRSSCNA